MTGSHPIGPRLAAHNNDPKAPRRRANMHEGVAHWCDCCVCEAEPYWAEIAAELGIDLSDYEEEGSK